MKSVIHLLVMFIFLLFGNQIIAQTVNNGHLVIIGGGKRSPEMMKKIIELAGGEEAKIMVLPMASGDPIDVAEYQVNQFKEYGAKNVDYLMCDSISANQDTTVEKLNDVTGIFFSGGDQRRLAKVLGGSKLLDRIYEIYENGGVVSGTSAGAAVMSEVMITGDEIKYPAEDDPHFSTIEAENIITINGFGFIKSAISISISFTVKDITD